MSGRITRSQQRKRQEESEEKTVESTGGDRKVAVIIEVPVEKKRGGRRGGKAGGTKNSEGKESASVSDRSPGETTDSVPQSRGNSEEGAVNEKAAAVEKAGETNGAKSKRFDSDGEENSDAGEKDAGKGSMNGASENQESNGTLNGMVMDEEDSDEEEESDDDEAPEAVSNTAGKEIIKAKEEEEKKVREQLAASARLKRKAHEARLKEQKLQSQHQTKRQKTTAAETSIPTPTDISPTPTPTPTTNDTTTLPPLTIQRTVTDSAEPFDNGITSPASSRTLSLQLPPNDQPHFPSRSTTGFPITTNSKKPKPPLLLPASILEEAASRPSPPPEEDTPKPSRQHKKLADFEAEEKAALGLMEGKKKKKGKQMQVFKKGAFRVAVVGTEEEREREKKIMAPPKSKGVAKVKEEWLTRRGGVERKSVPVGGGFGRRF